MKNFYFLRTKRLVEVLSSKEISNQTFLAYALYLIGLLSIYMWAPYFISPETRGVLNGRQNLSIVLQLLIVMFATFAILKISRGHRLLRILKSYVALYSTEAVIVFFVRILFGFLTLYVGVLIGIETDEGFQNSHYPTLISEITAVCGAELMIQFLMIYRFYQIQEKNRI